MDACKKLVVSCNFQPEYVIEGVLIRDGEFFVNIFKEEWLQNISTPVFPTPIFTSGPFQHRLENRCLFPIFYDIKNQFWAGLGSWAVLVEKKFGADYEQLLRTVFFYVFMGKK